MFTKILFIVILIIYTEVNVIHSHVIYEGLLKKDWTCMYGFESNNCDQTIDDNFKCSSHKVNSKGGDGVAIFPSNNRVIQLYHDNDVHETDHNIIIGWKFHCSSHCHTPGALLNSRIYGFNFHTDVAGKIWNQIAYTDKLFYTVFSINLTHVTTSIYQGGVPDANTWSITSYITHYGTGSILIDPNDPEMMQELKYSYIQGAIGDTYEDNTAYFQITYIATDAGFVELSTKSVPDPNDWMQAVDSVINWNYPVSFDGFTDTVSYYTNSNWGTFNFLNMNNFDQLFPGMHKEDVIGFSLQTYTNVGNKDYNSFGFRGGYRGDYAARFANCWSRSYVYLYPSRMDSTTEDYAQVYFGAELNSGSVQIYLRDFKWLFDSHNVTEEHVNCDDVGEITHSNWYDMTNNDDNSPDKPYANLTMDVDLNTLTFTFDIKLGYVGLTSDGYWDQAINLGSTYVISFNPFGIRDRLDQPGSCENRMESLFANKSFSDWWSYSETPYLPNHLGSDKYSAYPEPSYPWVLSMDSNNSCSRIHYTATFSWNDIQSCTDYNGKSLMEVVDDGEQISLLGKIYVTLVSPETMTSNSGYYRTFSLIQQEFGISISNQINVLDSAGIKLFIPLIFGNFPKNETDHSFILPIVVRSPQYIALDLPQVLITPFGTVGTSIQQITNGCILEGSYLCRQFFTIKIQSEVINCPPADFSGTYDMLFHANCRNGDNDQVCQTFINDNGGSQIALSVISDDIDYNCNRLLYTLNFDANMNFYDDIDFSMPHDSNSDYVIGRDQIYVQIDVNFPEDIDQTIPGYSIFDVRLDNVFVCTAPDGSDLAGSLNDKSGEGGCFSGLVDDAYDIILDGQPYDYNADIILSQASVNYIRFAFDAFDIPRTVMHIHAQVTLLLENGAKRRILLNAGVFDDNNRRLQDGEGTTTPQIRHFVHSTQVTQDSGEEDNDEKNKNDFVDSTTIWIMVIIGCVAVVVILFIFCVIKLGKKGQQKKLNMHQRVNTVDVDGGNTAVKQTTLDEIATEAINIEMN